MRIDLSVQIVGNTARMQASIDLDDGSKAMTLDGIGSVAEMKAELLTIIEMYAEGAPCK